ncbi:DNA-binding domain-containing protein [Rhizobium laguerreae]|uniref:DNA-binding domain-containing protein n=1 Tax=Rhizobium laguerreae TaxID=1076926 RepID=UPI001C903BF2|nr:DNA-binding domain-containing protein [Rhizobium laguerreae]MBY3048733.1 hypothetical protein [Rhizobium laguerreae]
MTLPLASEYLRGDPNRIFGVGHVSDWLFLLVRKKKSRTRALGASDILRPVVRGYICSTCPTEEEIHARACRAVSTANRTRSKDFRLAMPTMELVERLIRELPRREVILAREGAAAVARYDRLRARKDDLLN